MTITYTGTSANDKQYGVLNDRNIMYGKAGNDSLIGGDLNDQILGGTGNDTLDGGSGYDTLYGDDGNDTLFGDGGADYLSGGAGDDVLNGGDGADTLLSSSGNDILVGGSGDDRFYVDFGFIGEIKTIDAGSGEDEIYVGLGADLIDGGSGQDRVDYHGSNLGVSVNLQKGVGSEGYAAGDTYRSVEDVSGSFYDDTIIGNGNYNELFGWVGNDLMRGGAGGDFLDGGIGIDTLDYSTSDAGVKVDLATGSTYGGDAQGDQFFNFEDITGSDHADRLTGDSTINTLSGGAGNDVLQGGAGADNIVGGKGTDTADYSTSVTAVHAILEGSSTGGDAEGDHVSEVENLTGSGFADILTGSATANTLNGGAGNDLLTGGAGADALNGGAGTDTASYAGATAGLTINLANISTNTGDAKGDSYLSIENLTGSSFADTLNGNTGTNVLSGGGGIDMLFGGAGADKLIGGAGADSFIFKTLSESTVLPTGQDTIFDFSRVQGDKIDLSSIDAFSHTSGNQAFLFKGTAAFSGHDGELRYVKGASDTYVYGDVNGDKTADFSIRLDDSMALVASDFLL
ncbi:calcium-binding protein [Pararhizobium sp.]|uniref:calcium-binding protein n=1 Tax=Pararhizobium sp. TaxID=1977563 RepID=UPI003D0964E9